MAIEDNPTRESFERELTIRLKIRFWLRIITGMTIGITAQLYYGWKALFLVAFVYGVIDGIVIFAQQVKIAKIIVKYKEITEGVMSAEERGNILGQGFGKGAVLGGYSVLVVFRTVGGIAVVAKLVTSLFH